MRPRVRLFGRVPLGIYVLVTLIGASTLMGGFSIGSSWYVYNSTLVEPGVYTVSSQYFTPGPGGYIHVCTTYVSSQATICGPLSFNYSSGAGSNVITGLYWGLLGSALTWTLCSVGAGLAIAAGLSGKLRARRARVLAVCLLVVSLAAAAGGATGLAVLQPSAFEEFSGGCSGFATAATPCNALSGSAACAYYNGSTCFEQNVSWHPDVGWYLALASSAALAAVLIGTRFRPLDQPCPICGAENRYTTRFCDACGSALPSAPEIRSRKFRV